MGLTLLCSGCEALETYRVEQKAKDAVSRLLLDPGSAEFQNLAQRNGHVCGEVNAKNKMGAFVGFKRFVVDTAAWKPVIDPEFEYGDLLSAEELCSSMRSNSYSSLSATVSACSTAEEKRRLQTEQAEFDKVWASNCAGAVHRPFRPPPTDETALISQEANYALNIDSEVEGVRAEIESDATGASDFDGSAAAAVNVPDNAVLDDE